jgi:hypothetical protein
MNKLLIIILVLPVVMFGQTNQHKECRDSKVSKTDTISDLVIIHSAMPKQNIRKEERGLYKVIDIDTFNDFHLIFIEKDNLRSAIYSEKSIVVNGQKLEVDSVYFFELTCKDTLYNGMCITPIADVTYFDKYLGHELGKLNIAKNLIGLIIPNE